MPITKFSTPILLIIFNRPELTLQVFKSIRSVRPTRLFIAADGPRSNFEADLINCADTREIVSLVDWECDVQTLFRDENLGCGPGVSTAITWFFENVNEGIILEDDCLPSRSFYFFCEELLARYRNQAEVMHISGDNFQYGRKRGDASYYFSRYTHNWGWATWKRAWKSFDFSLIPEELRPHIWDKQWELSVAKQNGICILPNTNLVKNIGFGPDATHTAGVTKYDRLKAEELEFPLIHPLVIKIDTVADAFTEQTIFRNRPANWYFFYIILDHLKQILRRNIDVFNG